MLLLPSHLFVLLQIVTFTESIISTRYVVPNAPALVICPNIELPCLTLDEYLRWPSYFTSGSTFIFLAGTHSTAGTLILSRLSFVTFRGTQGAFIASLNGITLQNVNAFYIENLTFVNDPRVLSDGLALKIVYSHNIVISSSIFQGSRVKFSDYYVTIKSCEFVNSVGNNGGAIEGVRGKINLVNNTFSKNTAKFSGGAVNLLLSIVTLLENSFSSNIAGENGGALSCYECSIYIRSSNACKGEFSGNSAKHGGALYVNQSTVEISTCNMSFTSNWAESGGAIHFLDSSPILITSNVLFTNNSASIGGAVLMDKSEIKVKGYTIFSSNTASKKGGAILISYSNFSCNGSSLFNNNLASEHGGAIYSIGSLVLLNGMSPVVLQQNTADYGGGLSCQFSKLTLGNQVRFLGNIAQQYGGGLFLSAVLPLQISTIEGKFVENCGLKCGGAVAIQDASASFTNVVFTNNSVSAVCVLQSNVTFSNVDITNNTGKFGGGISTSYSSLSFANSISFCGNYASVGGAIYSQYGAISLNGVLNFSQNIATSNGGALTAFGTSISLQNVVNFTANSAERGGAMYFSNAAQLIMLSQEFSSLITSYNHATKYGGAIYHDDEYITPVQCNFVYHQNKISNLPQCFFRINGIFLYLTKNISVPKNTVVASFNDTSGIDGDFVYGGCFDRCQIPVLTLFSIFSNDFNSRSLLFYDILQENSFKLDSVQGKAISSLPYTLCFCSSDKEYHSCSEKKIQIYRGEIFNISLLAFDQMKTLTTSSVTAITNTTARLISRSSQLDSRTCSNLTYTLFSKEDHELITLYPNGPCRDTGLAKVIVKVALLPCPDTFILSEDKCICEKRLQEYGVNCTLESGIHIHKKAGLTFWMKAWYDVKGSYLGVILYKACPVEYCKTDAVTIPLDQMDVQCANNRSGMLCGACSTRYSLMLGSSRCKECSNNFLFLILLFAVAGIALVTFLSLLKLTVATGLINSLILYANIVQINKTIFLPNGYSRNVLTIFVAWLNLDFGFEICFFDGMDSYAQTWLQFAFPFYLWILISLIILISRYSITMSKLIGHNPIAVLATLLLMSYTKILQNIIVVYSAVHLDYPNNVTVRAWLKDANVPFLKSRHLLLAVITSLILILVFLPYTIFLLLGYKLYSLSGRKYLHWTNKIKPLLDSYYAPYTPSTRYWTGFLLLIRCALYVVFSVGGTSSSLLAINMVFTALLIIAWLSGKIYKDRIVNVTEASIYLNLVILSMNSATGTNSPALVYTLMGVVFSTMAAIVLYHFYLLQLLSKSATWKMACNKINVLYEALHGRKNVQNSSAGVSSHDPYRIVTKSVVELREPLLEKSL